MTTIITTGGLDPTLVRRIQRVLRKAESMSDVMKDLHDAVAKLATDLTGYMSRADQRAADQAAALKTLGDQVKTLQDQATTGAAALTEAGKVIAEVQAVDDAITKAGSDAPPA